MDNVLIDIYAKLVEEFHCSADDILECPDLRNQFLKNVREATKENLPERMLLHRLASLRKQRKLPRKRDLIANETTK